MYPIEFDILMAMDEVYCDEMNKEILDLQSKSEEESSKKRR